MSDNNFNPLVESILSSGKSIHIDGRAGCGKSTIIKMLQHAMNIVNKKLDLEYEEKIRRLENEFKGSQIETKQKLAEYKLKACEELAKKKLNTFH